MRDSNTRLLVTGRLRLRPLVSDDLDVLHSLWTGPEVRAFLWDGAIISRERTAGVIASSEVDFATHGFGLWAVLPREEDTLIGFCGLRRFGEPPEVEILYGLFPMYWGRGLATEAASAMLRHGFDELGLKKIFARADAPNAASIRVMEKTGMIYFERTVVNGFDTVCYARNHDS